MSECVRCIQWQKEMGAVMCPMCAAEAPANPTAPERVREWWIKGQEPMPNIAGKPILFTATSEPPQNPGWTRVIDAQDYAALEKTYLELRGEYEKLLREVNKKA